MADEQVYTGIQYKLRAGTPMYVNGEFVLHTFMAERYEIDIMPTTTEIVDSDAFRGQGGDYISGSYSRLLDKSGLVFNGRLVHQPTYIEEDEIE